MQSRIAITIAMEDFKVTMSLHLATAPEPQESQSGVWQELTLACRQHRLLLFKCSEVAIK